MSRLFILLLAMSSQLCYSKLVGNYQLWNSWGHLLYDFSGSEHHASLETQKSSVITLTDRGHYLLKTSLHLPDSTINLAEHQPAFVSLWYLPMQPSRLLVFKGSSTEGGIFLNLDSSIYLTMSYVTREGILKRYNTPFQMSKDNIDFWNFMMFRIERIGEDLVIQSLNDNIEPFILAFRFTNIEEKVSWSIGDRERFEGFLYEVWILQEDTSFEQIRARIRSSNQRIESELRNEVDPYINSRGEKCSEDCKKAGLSCYSEDASKCIEFRMVSCEEGCYDILHQKRVEICPNNCICHQGSDICISCLEGFTMIGNGCFSSKNSRSLSDNCKLSNFDEECIECDLGFYLGQGCEKCPESCEECHLNESNTLECNSCRTGNYLNQLQCDPCPDKCESCIKTDSEDLLCSRCITGYYTFESVCNPCPEKCYECTTDNSGNIECTSCILDYFLISSSCIKCSDLCTECIKTSLDSLECRECFEGYYPFGADCIECPGICTKCDKTTSGIVQCSECQTGYYPLGLECRSCSEGCRECYKTENDAVECSQCLSGYYPLQSGCIICPEGCDECQKNIFGDLGCSKCQSNYYLYESDCKKCPIECEECNIDSSHILECTDCISGYYLSSSGCTLCPGNCKECHNTLSGIPECTLCIQGYYLSGSTCIKCLQGCNECYKTDSNIIACTECTANYYLNQSVCKPCQAFCDACNINYSSILECTLCAANYYIYREVSGFTCLSKCPNEYYPSITSTPKCEQCDSRCLTCNNLTFCTSCKTGFFLLNNTCIDNCGIGYYPNAISSNCDPCSFKCNICDKIGGVLRCLVCDSSTYLKNGACYSNCGYGYYSNSITRKCDRCSNNCMTCEYSGIILMCKACFSPNYLKEGACVIDCGSGYYTDTITKNCQKCSDSNCEKCGTNLVCTQCMNGLGLQTINSNVICDACPEGTYLDSGVCVACMASCKVCTNASKCIECKSNSYMSSSKCYCSLGYTIEGNICVLSTTFTVSYAYMSTAGILIFRLSDLLNAEPLLSQLSIKLDSVIYTSDYFTITSEIPLVTYSLNMLDKSLFIGIRYAYILFSTSPKLISQHDLELSNTDYLVPTFSQYSQISCSSIEYCKNCYSAGTGVTCNECIEGKCRKMLYPYICSICCEDGYYRLSGTNDCYQCDTKCLTCDSIGCLSCSGLRYLLNNDCVKECGLSYYKSIIDNKCMPCVSNCLNCTDGTSCTLCAVNYVLSGDGKACNLCPTRTFYYNGGCSSCHDICETCLDTTSCSTCIDNAEKQSDNLCYCKLGYVYTNNHCVFTEFHAYANLDSSRKIILKFEKPLQTPLISSEISFLVSGSIYHNDRFSFSEIINNQVYQLIIPSLSYDNLAQITLNILTYSTKYAQDQSKLHESSIDIPVCPLICSSCESSESCTGCESGYYLKGNSCIQDCGNEYVKNPDTRVCQVCPSNCYTCGFISSNVVCSECKNGFGLQIIEGEYKCLVCPERTYLYTGICLECPKLCKNCITHNICTECDPHAHIIDNICECDADYMMREDVCIFGALLHAYASISNLGQINITFSEELKTSLTSDSIQFSIYDQFQIINTEYPKSYIVSFNTITYFLHDEIILTFKNRQSILNMHDFFLAEDSIKVRVDKSFICPQLCSECISATKCTVCDLYAVIDNSLCVCDSVNDYIPNAAQNACIYGANLHAYATIEDLGTIILTFSQSLKSSLAPESISFSIFDEFDLIEISSLISYRIVFKSMRYFLTSEIYLYFKDRYSMFDSQDFYLAESSIKIPVKDSFICPSNCSECQYQSVQLICNKCYDGYYSLINDGEYSCIDKCPSKYYPTSKQECKECIQNCDRCIESACIECSQGTYLLNGTCVTYCGLDYIPNNIAKSCDMCEINHCLECEIQNGKIGCRVCEENYVMIEMGSVIVCDICPDGKYYHDRECRTCYKLCKSCLDETLCYECKENSSIIDGVCSCDFGFEVVDESCIRMTYKAHAEFKNSEEIILHFDKPLRTVLDPKNIELNLSSTTYHNTNFIIKEVTAYQDYIINIKDIDLSNTRHIYIIFKDKALFIASDGSYLDYDTIDIYIPTHTTSSGSDTYISQSDYLAQDPQAQNLHSKGSTASSSVTGGAALISITSVSSLWSFITSLQMFSLIPLLNVDLPIMLYAFLSSLRGYCPFPNMMEYLITVEDPKPTYRAGLLGYKTSLFLYNAGEMITTFLFSLICYILGFILKLIIPKKYSDRLLARKLLSFLDGFKWNMFIRFFIESYIELSIAATLQVVKIYKIPNFESMNQIINVIIGCLFMVTSTQVLVIVIPFLLMRFIHTHNGLLNEKEFMKKWGTLFEDIKTSSIYFYSYFLLWRLLQTILFFGLSDYPPSQCIYISLICWAKCYYIARNRPFKHRVVNILSIISEVNIALSYSLAGLFLINLDDSVEYVIQWGIISLVICSVILNILHMISSLVSSIIQFIKARRQKAVAIPDSPYENEILTIRNTTMMYRGEFTEDSFYNKLQKRNSKNEHSNTHELDDIIIEVL